LYHNHPFDRRIICAHAIRNQMLAIDRAANRIAQTRPRIGEVHSHWPVAVLGDHESRPGLDFLNLIMDLSISCLDSSIFLEVSS